MVIIDNIVKIIDDITKIILHLSLSLSFSFNVTITVYKVNRYSQVTKPKNRNFKANKSWQNLQDQSKSKALLEI